MTFVKEKFMDVVEAIFLFLILVILTFLYNKGLFS